MTMTDTSIVEFPGETEDGDTLLTIFHNDRMLPTDGLQAAYLIEEGGEGRALVDAMGGANGVIEHPNAVNNAFLRQEDGGVRLDGTEICSFAPFNAAEPWTLCRWGSVIGSVGGTASERIAGLMGFREWTVQPRAALTCIRGGVDWSLPAAAPFLQARPANGAGGQAAAVDLQPTVGLGLIGRPFLMIMAYDGETVLRTSAYGASGELMATVSIAVTPAQLFTIGAVTVTNLTPVCGGLNNVYAGGRQIVDQWARYDRFIADFHADEIDLLAFDAGRKLGELRPTGRWAA